MFPRALSHLALALASRFCRTLSQFIVLLAVQKLFPDSHPQFFLNKPGNSSFRHIVPPLCLLFAFCKFLRDSL